MRRQLDTIEPRDFDELVAFDRLEPDPLDRIREILKLGFATLCAVSGFGAKIDPDELDPVTRDKAKGIVTSPEEAVKVLGNVYGF